MADEEKFFKGIKPLNAALFWIVILVWVAYKILAWGTNKIQQRLHPQEALRHRYTRRKGRRQLRH